MVRKKATKRHGQKSVAGSRAAPASGFTRMPVQQVLALNLRRMLDDKRVSAEELARRTDYSLSYVEEILRGHAGILEAGDVEAIAHALGIEASDLLERDGSQGV